MSHVDDPRIRGAFCVCLQKRQNSGRKAVRNLGKKPELACCLFGRIAAGPPLAAFAFFCAKQKRYRQAAMSRKHPQAASEKALFSVCYSFFGFFHFSFHFLAYIVWTPRSSEPLSERASQRSSGGFHPKTFSMPGASCARSFRF